MNCNPCCGCFPPITTYNPSAADNFPTILQQVEYLKALLKKYPSQQWFISTEKVTPETVTITTSSIVLHERALQESDFILATSNDDKATILLFQYVGASSSALSVVEYVGVFSNQDVAEQALSLAQTNEKDISTLDGEVAILETNVKNAIYVASDKQELTQDEYNRLTNDVSTKIRRGTSDQRIYHFFAFSNGVYIYVSTGGSQNTPPSGLYAMKVYKDNNGRWCEYIGGFNFAVLGKTVEVYNNKTLVIAGKPSTNVYTINVDGDFASGFTGLYLPVSGGHALVKEQLKTIFGNQSLIGTGNIDLYKHHINLNITGKSLYGDLYIDIISSNSLNCDSLTDIKTLLGQTFTINCFGLLIQDGTNERYAYFATDTEIVVSGGSRVNWSEITTITDTVTTI